MNGHRRRTGLVWTVILLHAAVASLAWGQGGYNDDRVMIQGFMWESHQQGKQKGEGGYEYEVDWKDKWYDHVKSNVDELADAKFDLVWLPPPSQGEGAGYHPQQYHNFHNNYGTEAQHKALIDALLGKGIEPVADLVINHRNGTGGWATFKNPAWPAKYICSTDEFWFQDPQTNDTLSAKDKEILAQGDKGAPDYLHSNYPNWHGARDLDHTSAALRKDLKTYLDKLRKFGYWKHYFEWKRGGKIKPLIRARKYAGVHSGSYLTTEEHGSDYVAVVGDKPSESSTLIVKIGPGLDFKPDENIWGLETHGEGYAVWIRKSKKAETKDEVDKPKPAFAIPANP